MNISSFCTGVYLSTFCLIFTCASKGLNKPIRRSFTPKRHRLACPLSYHTRREVDVLWCCIGNLLVQTSKGQFSFQSVPWGSLCLLLAHTTMSHPALFARKLGSWSSDCVVSTSARDMRLFIVRWRRVPVVPAFSLGVSLLSLSFWLVFFDTVRIPSKGGGLMTSIPQMACCTRLRIDPKTLRNWREFCSSAIRCSSNRCTPHMFDVGASPAVGCPPCSPHLTTRLSLPRRSDKKPPRLLQRFRTFSPLRKTRPRWLPLLPLSRKKQNSERVFAVWRR